MGLQTAGPSRKAARKARRGHEWLTDYGSALDASDVIITLRARRCPPPVGRCRTTVVWQGSDVEHCQRSGAKEQASWTGSARASSSKQRRMLEYNSWQSHRSAASVYKPIQRDSSVSPSSRACTGHMHMHRAHLSVGSPQRLVLLFTLQSACTCSCRWPPCSALHGNGATGATGQRSWAPLQVAVPTCRVGAAAYHILRGEPQLGGSQ